MASSPFTQEYERELWHLRPSHVEARPARDLKRLALHLGELASASTPSRLPLAAVGDRRLLVALRDFELLEGGVGGGLLGGALRVAGAAGDHAGAGLHLHDELGRVAGTAVLEQRVRGHGLEPRLRDLLEPRLGVDHALRREARRELLVEKRLEHRASRLDAAVEIDGGDECFEGPGEEGWTIAPASARLAATQEQVLPEVQVSSPAGKRGLADEPGTQDGEIAFTRGWPIFVQSVSDDDAQNGVAEKLHTLVGRESFSGALVHVGRVDERGVQQVEILEGVAQRALKRGQPSRSHFGHECAGWVLLEWGNLWLRSAGRVLVPALVQKAARLQPPPAAGRKWMCASLTPGDGKLLRYAARVELRRLGRSGLKVSAIGLGGNTFGATVDDEAAVAVIQRALDLGITFVDTADIYSHGRSEELVGRAIAGRRDSVVVATKLRHPMSENPYAGGLSRRWIVDEVEHSLRRLQTDYVDLYQAHAPDPETPIEETLRAMDDLVRQGKVRYVGGSNYQAWQMAQALGIGERGGLAPWISAQNRWNVVDGLDDPTLLPAARELGFGIIPYMPLASGILTGKYRAGEPPAPGTRAGDIPRIGERLTDERLRAVDRLRPWAEERGHSTAELAIAWLLAYQEVGSVIVGARTPEQVEQNVRAAAWTLSPAERDEVRALVAQRS